VGQIIEKFLANKCKEKFDKDVLFNAQLDYCYKVAGSNRDASKNKKLQKELLVLAEVSAITGNSSTKYFFSITYIRSKGTSFFGDVNGGFYSTKWLKIPRKEVE